MLETERDPRAGYAEASKGNSTNNKTYSPPAQKSKAPSLLYEQAPVDSRLCFLERAHARLILFHEGLMTLDEAYGGLVDRVPCDCGHRGTA
jgi:hypothetical protein